MIDKQAFIDTVLDRLPGEPTEDQKIAIEKLSKFILQKKSNNIFILRGYAGTGKTTLLSAVIRNLKDNKIKNVELLAPTGRAAKVLSTVSGYSAYTIHKRIYKAEEKGPFTRFILNYKGAKNTIFIADESSMIGNNSDGKKIFGSGYLLDDLIKYVYQVSENSKIIFAGDTAQLPPFSTGFSPAMDKNYLEKYGLEVQCFTMREVIRQALNSGILYNATTLRNLIDSNRIQIPKFSLQFNDFEHIYGEDLVEKIDLSYQENGIDQTLIITYSNKRANQYNKGIRERILQRENVINVDESLMIVKNNYFWARDSYIPFIANGDLAMISQIFGYQEVYDLSFADVELYFPDYDQFINAKILLDTLEMNYPSMPYERFKEFYKKIEEDYSHIKNKKARREEILKDPFFNALQVKYAYAITCHKAQGGQWHTVFIDQGYFNSQNISIDYLKWLYTAITRSTAKVYLVNFLKDFFV